MQHADDLGIGGCDGDGSDDANRYTGRAGACAKVSYNTTVGIAAFVVRGVRCPLVEHDCPT